MKIEICFDYDKKDKIKIDFRTVVLALNLNRIRIFLQFPHLFWLEILPGVINLNPALFWA